MSAIIVDWLRTEEFLDVVSRMSLHERARKFGFGREREHRAQ